MGGFLRGGMRPKESGRGRAAFLRQSSSDMPMPPRHNPIAAESESGEGGEDAGSALAKMHAKHGGHIGMIQHDGMGGPVTTHHIGPDGEVSGPNEHATTEEAAGHLAQCMSGGMDNEASEPDGDEYVAD